MGLTLATPVLACPPPGEGYQITRLGLQGPDFQRGDGKRSTSIAYLGDDGLVLGTSARYDGLLSRGQDAWLFEGGVTRRIGPLGAPFQAADGTRQISVSRPLDENRILGHAVRFSGDTNLGGSPWVLDADVLRVIAPPGPEHVRSDGFISQFVLDVSATGVPAGQVERFPVGREDAWAWVDGETVLIGLNGSEYQRADGYRFSRVTDLYGTISNGPITGYTRRFLGMEDAGRDAWIFDGTSTIRIGLIGPDNTRADGFRVSDVRARSEQMVAGNSYQFSRSQDSGTDAWLYTGVETIQLGLSGPQYTDANGRRASRVGGISEGGHVLGVTETLALPGGQHTWIWRGSSHTRIGLTGPGYVDQEGVETSIGYRMNMNGHVIGISVRYGAGEQGQDVWLFDGSTTQRVNPVGGAFERSDGFREATPYWITSDGQVFGWSKRFIGADEQGQSAWFYDPLTDTLEHILGPTSDSGRMYVEPWYPTDSGVLLGLYAAYEADVEIERRFFWWSDQAGLHDLAALVRGGLPAAGWVSLDGRVPLRLVESTASCAPVLITGRGTAAGGSPGARDAWLLSIGLCPADVSFDGRITDEDLLIYLNRWFSMNTRAERTGDDPHVIDVFDLLAYLNDWFTGC